MMKEDFQTRHPAHLWLLAGLVLAFMPHFFNLPALIIIPSIALLIWRLLFDLKLVALPSNLIRILLTLFAIGAIFASYQALFGRQSGTSLLVVMLCLKLLEMKTSRDVGVVIGLGYFVVITVFLDDQSIFMGLYMAVVVTLLTTALISFSRLQSKVSPWKNLQYSGQLLAQAIPLMLLLFILFPRIPGPLWSLPTDINQATTGLSDSMSPGRISRLSDNNAVAFRVKFKDPIPPPQQRYWRGPVFTYFDGVTWNQGDTARHGLSTLVDLSYRAIGDPVRYTVTLEPHRQRWLFALDMIGQTPINSKISVDFEILRNQPVLQLLRYETYSYPNYLLRASTPPDTERYLQLPQNIAPKARRLAQEFRNTSLTKPARVEAALNYFRQKNFIYTRQPPLLLNDPVDEFLFDSQRGFCEHYASAFVFLMRAAGIPARVVTGYLGGETNPLGDYFIVRQSNAHAWAEVWLEDKGWLRVDPTAVIPAHRIENPNDLERLLPNRFGIREAPGWLKHIGRQALFGWDQINHSWNQWVIDYNDKRQKDFLAKLFPKLGIDDINWKTMVSVLALGFLMILSFIGLYLMRRLILRNPKKDPVQLTYQRFCRKLARKGLKQNHGEGAESFSHRICVQYPQHTTTVSHITSLYQDLRYAPHTASGNLKELQLAVRKFKP